MECKYTDILPPDQRDKRCLKSPNEKSDSYNHENIQTTGQIEAQKKSTKQ